MDWRRVQDVFPPLLQWLLGSTPALPGVYHAPYVRDETDLRFPFHPIKSMTYSVVSKPTTKNSHIHTLELEGATGSLNHSFTLSHQRNFSKGCRISRSPWILLNGFLFSMDLVLTVFLWTSAAALILSWVFLQFFHKFDFTDLILPWNFSALILGLECWLSTEQSLSEPSGFKVWLL